MWHLRIGIAQSMGLVVLSAIGLTALTHPSPIWVAISYSLALAVNFASIVAAISSEGVGRKCAAGFAVCGWGYFFLSQTNMIEVNSRLYLLTTLLIEICYRRGLIDPFSFTKIAHSFFGIASGLAGALFAWWLAPRLDTARPIPSPMGPS